MQTTEANTHNNADTNTNTNANNNANIMMRMTLGDCARLLVAARLPLLLSSSTPPPPQQQQLTFEALLEALRQRPLVAAAGRLFAAFVALAEDDEARHHHDGGAPPTTTTTTTTERHTRTRLTACMIAAHPHNVFEFPTEPLEAALSAATAPFLSTFGRLVVAVATSQLWGGAEQEVEGHDSDDDEQQLLLLRQILLPFGLLLATATAELLPQMAAFEAAHAAWTAADVPRLVRRISLGLLGLAQAHATALAAPADHDALIIVAQIDTSIDRLRTQLLRLDGGTEALAAIDAAVGDGVAAADLLMLPDLNLLPHHHLNNDNNPNDDADA
jgi:hypothetical protein